MHLFYPGLRLYLLEEKVLNCEWKYPVLPIAHKEAIRGPSETPMNGITELQEDVRAEITFYWKRKTKEARLKSAECFLDSPFLPALPGRQFWQVNIGGQYLHKVYSDKMACCINIDRVVGPLPVNPSYYSHPARLRSSDFGVASFGRPCRAVHFGHRHPTWRP